MANAFVLDAYKGWTEAQLKRRCCELVSLAIKKDLLICAMVDFGGVDGLPSYQRDEVKRIWSTYCDESAPTAEPNGSRG
ncbi:hypothetical protein [Bradyrhizobium elkanii]|uniref:hypothetical protein n=1 Tax=Bradyrhizobium elkanii TaxID=29448 RepID=UPI002228038B|nr:hypothetical protein [Bradyrhizobium elkanii]MCW2228058.1 hypothetical protein [Bradyrhizobium elkanii]